MDKKTESSILGEYWLKLVKTYVCSGDDVSHISG